MFSSRDTKYAILRLCILRGNEELKQMYRAAADKHNTQLENELHYNAGFDLITPADQTFSHAFETYFINLGVKAEMKMVDKDSRDYVGYYLYPRSSISKTPLMMANHVGIIDSGYRGEIMAAVRTFQPKYDIQAGSRLFQICHPSLIPMYVELVNDPSELTDSTRGEGGFGSTGGLNK